MHYEDLIERLRKGTALPMLQALMNEAADAIEEQSKPKWIRVEERLPEPFDIVIVSVLTKNGDGEPDRFESLSSWEHGKWVMILGCLLLEDGERITHWMPLPEPPKEAIL